MAAGDTLKGQVKAFRETSGGNLLRLFGPFSSGQIDPALDLAESLFVNPSNTYPAPKEVARIVENRAARLWEKETFYLKHKSSNLEEAIDHDADTVEIDYVDKDINTGELSPGTMNVADNLLTQDPTSDKSEYVTFFEVEVPSGHKYFISGYFRAAAVEAS